MTSHATISTEPVGLRWRSLLPVAASLALTGVGLLSSDYIVTVLGFAFIYAIFCTGLNFFMGYTGQASFGQSAFAAIGGYGSAILCTDYGWEPLLALIATMAISGVAAVVVGYPTLRLRGHYLAMATFALGLIVYEISIEWTSLTQGYMGYAGIAPLGIAGFELGTIKQQLVALVVLALLGVGIASRLRQSRFGRALAAIAGSEPAARALGIDIARCKLIAFVIAALYASAAGSLFAHFIGFISPEVFGITMVVQSFAMLYLGGIGTMWGPMIGAIIVMILPEAMRGLKEMQDIAYTAVLIFILIFAPRGLAEIPALVRRLRRHSKEAQQP
ncbi:MAG: branched-chain amino acid ABC transporter permease [Pseudaminobacter sp.]